MYNPDFIGQLGQALEDWKQAVDDAVEDGRLAENSRSNYRSLPGIFVDWIRGDYDFPEAAPGFEPDVPTS